MVVVELKKMHMRADSIEVKGVSSTNPDFPCLRSELWFEVLPVQRVYDLVFLFQRQSQVYKNRAARDELEDDFDLVRREDIKMRS